MMKSATVIATLLAAKAGADVTPEDWLSSGMPFKEPVKLYAEDGVLNVELEYTTCDYHGPVTSFVTRCYAYDGVPMIPGPTLYVKPGDTLTVKLTNTLSDHDDIHYHNFWQHLNWTNLHFHGAHISADVPADDVLTMIPAKNTTSGYESSIEYIYKIEEYHMPGTAWYHPHGHGSATMQTGTGTLGMIIIEDTAVHVPSYIRNAPEKVVALWHVPIEDIELFGMQTCSNSDIMTPTHSGPEGLLPMGPAAGNWSVGETGIGLANGMSNPSIPIMAGEWTRLRLLMGSPLFMFNGAPEAAAEVLMGCSLKLLAKDTIYLETPLRDITKIFLYPGSRADVMVKCDVPGELQFNSVYFQGQEALTHHVPNFIGNLFKLNILPSEEEPAGDLPAFQVQRPCYLANTQAVLGDEEYVTKKTIIYDNCETGGGEEHRKLAEVDDAEHAHEWTYDEYPGSALAIFLAQMGVEPFASIGLETCMDLADKVFQAKTGRNCINGCSFELGYQNPIASEFASTTLMTPLDSPAVMAAAADVNAHVGDVCGLDMEYNRLQVGSIIEWDVWGIDFHPVHFHVHPYRLVEMDYELGNQMNSDIPDQAAFEALTGNFYAVGDYGDSMMIPVKHAKFHQNLANFATHMVNHCHILLHEDVGMMTLYNVLGEEGTLTRAQEIDPECYWTEEEHTGFTVTGECSADGDCPTGWMCAMKDHEDRRRGLKFGTIHLGVCTEMM